MKGFVAEGVHVVASDVDQRRLEDALGGLGAVDAADQGLGQIAADGTAEPGSGLQRLAMSERQAQDAEADVGVALTQALLGELYDYADWSTGAVRDLRPAIATLRAKGEDVFVGGVSAYSTLGWFHDPILNTWVHQADADLADAGVIFGTGFAPFTGGPLNYAKNQNG